MRRLLIFLKYPTPGQVKTRLAVSLGDETAAEIYRACIELTLERLSSLSSETTVCVDPASACDRARAWLGSPWHVHPQVGATLGERLTYAVTEAFEDGVQRVACIGTDSPWLTAQHIDGAFAALDRSDVAIGPTEDGGYYLIGLSRQIPELFDGIAWSAPSVFRATLAKARALHLRIQTLPLGYDVDRFEDGKRFVEEERATGHSSRWLDTIEAAINAHVSPWSTVRSP